jgi:hypothetical protein
VEILPEKRSRGTIWTGALAGIFFAQGIPGGQDRLIICKLEKLVVFSSQNFDDFYYH